MKSRQQQRSLPTQAESAKADFAAVGAVSTASLSSHGGLLKSHNKQALAEVHLFEQEWDEAIKVAEGRDVWYTVVETVADGVIEHRPEWVARASLKHAERLMEEAKSKNYPIAAEWLKRAKEAHKRLGQTQEWRAYLEKTKEKHKRRPGLQAQLARL